MTEASTRRAAPNNKAPGQSADRRVRRTLFRPDRAIPRQVAPQQSPLPFRPAPRVYRGHATNHPEFQNRPNAPPGSDGPYALFILVEATTI
jgi:hypothetical protein